MNLITDTAVLSSFCEVWSQQEFITIDLEFMRVHTYYAEPCLIQIGSKADCAIIDPKAPELDMQPFFELLQNPAVTKVFHSGRQDIEILYGLTKQIPTPVFDTQIAAMVLGFGESIGYENLVRAILQLDLDKSSRLSDWSARPLKPSQLEYALGDVTHLIPIYEHMRDKLAETGRTHWIDEEMAILTNPDTYNINPAESWLRIRHHTHNRRFLTLLRDLCAWREARCQKHNTPRQSPVKDEMLMTIASICPETKEQLSAISILRKDIFSGKLGDEIIKVIQNFLTIPESEYVQVPPAPPTLSHNTSLYELIKMLLRIRSREEGIVPRLLASEEDIRRFCRGHDKNNLMMQGWRYEIFGHDAAQLRRGKYALTFNPRRQHIEIIKKSSLLCEEAAEEVSPVKHEETPQDL